MPEESVLSTIDLGLEGHSSGKVRESWSLPSSRRILITTDRLSAFDRVVGLVRYKGQVLNQLSAWWFEETKDIVGNHLLSLPDPNVSLVKDVKPLPVEVVMRSRLTGSTSTSVLPRYLAGERKLYGYDLPDGLQPHGPLPEVLLTPTTKALDGQHDSPITTAQVAEQALVEPLLWKKVQDVALQLFERGLSVAAEAGYILADTKYEFGIAADGELLLIDEVHTPDSSRYWSIGSLEKRLAAGQEPESFDKEPVRLALKEAGYTGEGSPPVLPSQVWEDSTRRYVELYEGITGQTFRPGSTPIHERIHKSLSLYTSNEEN